MSKWLQKFIVRMFRSNETHVHELNYLFWECTTRCNLHCRHCGSDCSSDTHTPDMPLEDFLKAFDTIPASHRPERFTVVLTGGEPLLRPDIAETGRALRQRGVGWGLVTNGVLYDRNMHARLMSAGMGTLTISLDGLEKEHDWMRQRESGFSKTIEAIATAAKEPKLAFDVVTCVNRRNLPQLSDMHGMLASMGVRQWRLFTIIPIGRAKENPELHLSDRQFVELMEFIKDKRRNPVSNMNVTFGCEGYLGPYEMEVRPSPYMCHAGINIASVLSDGTISACPNIDREAFSQGNIYHDDFYKVWEEKFEPFRNRQWARKGQCSGCKVFRDCLGNGMHNWHGNCDNVINCHYRKIMNVKHGQ